jgi:hypothetical protein
MPDLVRSVDDMVADSDMERPLEDSEPAGNTGCAKHRQHVAQVTEELISSQFISGKMRYIEDGTGSKAATKTAPTLLTLAAVVQGMVSEMSGRKMSYTITIEGKGAAAAAPKPFKTGKLRGRAGRRKIRRRKRLKPSRKEEMHTKKQLLILIKSMMTESDTWTLVSETSSRVGELT